MLRNVDLGYGESCGNFYCKIPCVQEKMKNQNGEEKIVLYEQRLRVVNKRQNAYAAPKCSELQEAKFAAGKSIPPIN